VTKIFLVTTSDKTLWPNNKKILLLGKWCLSDYTVETFPENIEILPYHWDDREKMYHDYLYLQELYEKTLHFLILELNKFHNVTHSERYWRILIGPWLYVFIQTLFDRWELVRTAADFCEIEDTVILKFKPEKFILTEFKDIKPDDDEWAHYLFAEAIKFQNRIPWHEENSKTDKDIPEKKQKKSECKKSLLKQISSLFNAFLSRLQWPTEVFVINTYLPRWATIKLQLALGQVPKLWPTPSSPNVPPKMGVRTEWTLSDNSPDMFYQFLLKMIPLQLPTVYLEGYNDLCAHVDELPWPSKPSTIFTSNLFQFCEVFQAWTAQKVEKGSRYIIGQHGGLYGIGKWHCGEEHQIKVADRFISWGWSDERDTVCPGFALTNVGKPIKSWKPDGTLLFVTAPIRLFGYKNISWPMGPNQAVSFLNDQLSFINCLPAEVRNRTIVRINKVQDKCMKARFYQKISQQFDGIVIDDSRYPIEEKIRECRVFVYSCNSTGYLETLSRNIPTVIFWAPTNFELRNSAIPYFEKLKDARIFFDSPIAASQHIIEVWDNVSDWWDSQYVQSVREEFCNEYSRVSMNPINELKNLLNNTVSKSYENKSKL